MKEALRAVFWIGAATLTPIRSTPASAPLGQEVMVVKVTPDRPVGSVHVDPIAWLAADGKWTAIRCDIDHPKECRLFGRDYLSKPHSYTIVSADGRGARVQVEHMSFNSPKDCFYYGGEGTLSGTQIRSKGVGAGSEEIFRSGPPARRLQGTEAENVIKADAAAGEVLDSTKELYVYSLVMEGKHLFVIQRAFDDYGQKPEYKKLLTPFDPILTIGTMQGGRFTILASKEKGSDENEGIIGLIHLKSGRDFLIDSVTHPEGYYYRIFGIRNGRVAVVFSGDGGGC